MITRRQIITSAVALPVALALPIRSQAMELTDDTLDAFIVGGRRVYELDDETVIELWTPPFQLAEYWALAFETPEDAERAFPEIYETQYDTATRKLSTLPGITSLDVLVPPVGNISKGEVFRIHDEEFSDDFFVITLYWQSQNIVYFEFGLGFDPDELVRLSVEAAGMTSNVSHTGRKRDLLNAIPDLPSLVPEMALNPDGDMTFSSTNDLVEKLTT